MGGFVKKIRPDLVEDDGFQQSALEIPGLSKEESSKQSTAFTVLIICAQTDPSDHQKTMLEDKDVFVRVAVRGYEFFKSLKPAQGRFGIGKECHCHCSAAPATV